MRVYGYVRLSRDEDKNKESLNTQIDIIHSYAKDHNMNLIKVIEDDNVSGYSFERPGLEQLTELVKNNEVDLLLVKDLSRLGRHNAHTQLYLELLKEYEVRIIAITENYDSHNDSDDFVGIKTWINEIYVKDISKKIKANIKQKQRSEGLVIIPHYGFMKNPNNKKEVFIDEDAATVVKMIFKLYIEGHGYRKIAQILTDKGIPAPGEYKKQKFGIPGRATDTQQHLWYENCIKRIIQNDAYTGVLRCGVTKVKGIKGKQMRTDESEQFIHEGYYPVIISKEDYDLVQELNKGRVKNNIRAKNEKIHLYAGILECEDCGKGFVARRVSNKITYRCATYHRYGIDHCTNHSIDEHELNEFIFREIKHLHEAAKLNILHMDKALEEQQRIKKNYEKVIDKLKIQIFQKKDEIKNYARQLAKGMIGEEIFQELTQESTQQLNILQEQLEQMEEMKEINESHKANVYKSAELMEAIISKGSITNRSLHLLINKISIKQVSEAVKFQKPILEITIDWKKPFIYHVITPSCDNVILWTNQFKETISSLAIAM